MLDFKKVLLDAISDKINLPDHATLAEVNAYCEELLTAVDIATDQHFAKVEPVKE